MDVVASFGNHVLKSVTFGVASWMDGERRCLSIDDWGRCFFGVQGFVLACGCFSSVGRFCFAVLVFYSLYEILCVALWPVLVWGNSFLFEKKGLSVRLV